MLSAVGNEVGSSYCPDCVDEGDGWTHLSHVCMEEMDETGGADSGIISAFELMWRGLARGARTTVYLELALAVDVVGWSFGYWGSHGWVLRDVKVGSWTERWDWWNVYL